MAKFQAKTKENPKLEYRLMKDGRESLRLVYYHGRKQVPVLDEDGNQVYYTSGKMAGKPKYKIQHLRTKESLGMYLYKPAKTAQERRHNRDTEELAKRIRFEREQQFKESQSGYRLKTNKAIGFIDYFQSYIDSYTKKDIRMMQIALQRFKDFLSFSDKYSIYSSFIRPDQLNKDMIIDFTDYLKSRSKGEGAKSIYQRFKKVINHAIEHGVMAVNPCNGVSITVDEQVLRKDILSLQEIERLVETHYPNERENVRNAFIFCLYTGLRFCDVKTLTYGNVDFPNKMLRLQQNKTEGHSKRSGVVMKLKDNVLKMIGTPKTDSPESELVFNLPTYESCTKSLRRWVKRAGINKRITWHSARHSFAVNLLNNKANIKTVSSLLGHSGLRHTEKYTRAVDELKNEAIDSLPDLEF